VIKGAEDVKAERKRKPSLPVARAAKAMVFVEFLELSSLDKIAHQPERDNQSRSSFKIHSQAPAVAR